MHIFKKIQSDFPTSYVPASQAYQHYLDCHEKAYFEHPFIYTNQIYTELFKSEIINDRLLLLGVISYIEASSMCMRWLTYLREENILDFSAKLPQLLAQYNQKLIEFLVAKFDGKLSEELLNSLHMLSSLKSEKPKLSPEQAFLQIDSEILRLYGLTNHLYEVSIEAWSTPIQNILEQSKHYLHEAISLIIKSFETNTKNTNKVHIEKLIVNATSNTERKYLTQYIDSKYHNRFSHYS